MARAGRTTVPSGRLAPADAAASIPTVRPAAVLAVLADGPGGAEILLTRRSSHLRSHRGEMSFPGGRLEGGEDALTAALRETEEEVGLDPALVAVAGALTPLSTWVSGSWIVPVVATLASPLPAPLTPRTGEVDRVLWVPVHHLTAPGTYREERWHSDRGEHDVHFFELDDETVWGATARMLHELLALVYAG